MLSIAIVINLWLTQTTVAAEGVWVTRTIQHVSGQARKSSPWGSKTNVVQRTLSANADPTIYVTDGVSMRPMNTQELEAFYERIARNSDRSTTARRLLFSKDLGAARDILESMMQEDDAQYGATLMLAEVAALQRRYDEVLLLLSPFASDMLQTEGKLLLAYAASHTGRVYSGQNEYCERQIRRSSLTEEGISVAGDAKALAALALGHEYDGTSQDEIAMDYYNQVLDREPSNPLANLWLGIILERKQHYDLAMQKYGIAIALGGSKVKKVATIQADSLRNRIGGINLGGTTGGS